MSWSYELGCSQEKYQYKYLDPYIATQRLYDICVCSKRIKTTIFATLTKIDIYFLL